MGAVGPNPPIIAHLWYRPHTWVRHLRVSKQTASSRFCWPSNQPLGFQTNQWHHDDSAHRYIQFVVWSLQRSCSVFPSMFVAAVFSFICIQKLIQTHRGFPESTSTAGYINCKIIPVIFIHRVSLSPQLVLMMPSVSWMHMMNMHRHCRSDYRGPADEVANAAVPIKCVTAEEREKTAARKKRGVARQFEATPTHQPTEGSTW